MTMPAPVVVGPDERRNGGRRQPGEDLGAVDAEQLEILEDPFVVTALLLNVSRRGTSATPAATGSRPARARASASSISGTVARMIQCVWIAYSGQSSMSRECRKSVVQAAANGPSTS